MSNRVHDRPPVRVCDRVAPVVPRALAMDWLAGIRYVLSRPSPDRVAAALRRIGDAEQEAQAATTEGVCPFEGDPPTDRPGSWVCPWCGSEHDGRWER